MVFAPAELKSEELSSKLVSTVDLAMFAVFCVLSIERRWRKREGVGGRGEGKEKEKEEQDKG